MHFAQDGASGAEQMFDQSLANEKKQGWSIRQGMYWLNRKHVSHIRGQWLQYRMIPS